MKTPFFVLASASPRRRAVLKMLGVRHKTAKFRFGERTPRTFPEDAALLLAWQKLHTARKHIHRGTIITADTVVALNGRIFGKPRSKREAEWMLKRLSGKTHEVITALAMYDTASETSLLSFERTFVTMRAISAGEIAGYVRSGEPFDKAGAYGIQGMGGTLVSRIKGDYFNVVGFPIRLFALFAGSTGFKLSESRLESVYSKASAFAPARRGRKVSVHFP